MQIGDKLPDFKLKGTDGQWHTQYAFADKYAFAVVFTCNSCPVSRAYAQRLINLFQKFEEDNLGIVGINANDASQAPEDSYEEMVKVADRLGLGKLHFLYLQDDTQAVAKAFGVKVNPEVFLFNSKRELVYKGAIDDSWENEAMTTQVWLEDAIENALDGIEVDYPEIPAVGCDVLWKK